MASQSGTPSKTQLLLEAAFTGNLPRLKKLVAELDDGKGIAKRVSGIKDAKGLSAIHFAAEAGRLDVCKYLIDDLKIDVNLKDGKAGDTPLHHAVLDGHLSTVVYLLENGASPDMKNDSGFTPLHYVAHEGHKELLHLLLSRGVDVNSLSDLGTPLHRAAGMGKHEALKVLLDHHANPNVYINRVFTPLTSSILANSVACLKLLIEAGADPNAGSCGVTPLLIAAGEGQIEMIECLLKAGADPEATNEFGLKPIELAALNGNHEGVKILYPMTSPISSYLDWSFDGIMRHVHSAEARDQRHLIVEKKFVDIKNKGEAAFREKDYLTAILWYTQALEIDPCSATVLSNRSLCWARLKEGDRALTDAESCISLKPEWPKAYYRAGAACTILRKFDKAADAFLRGLKLDPENKELRNALQETLVAMDKAKEGR